MMIMNKRLLWIIILKYNLAILPKKEVKIEIKSVFTSCKKQGENYMVFFTKAYLKIKIHVQKLKNKSKNIPSESMGFRATP